MKLNRSPICEWPGCERAASQVDHITPKVAGGEDEWSNLQSLCASHHSIKTANEDGGFGRVASETDQVVGRGHPSSSGETVGPTASDVSQQAPDRDTSISGGRGNDIEPGGGGSNFTGLST